MKKLPIFIATVLLLFTVIAFMPSANSVIGRWVVTFKNGSKTYVQFHQNGKVTAQIPSEHFEVGGKYTFKQNILKISDTSCNGAYWGSYKFTFQDNGSIYSEAIADSCGPRRSCLDKEYLVREK